MLLLPGDRPSQRCKLRFCRTNPPVPLPARYILLDFCKTTVWQMSDRGMKDPISRRTVRQIYSNCPTEDAQIRRCKTVGGAIFRRCRPHLCSSVRFSIQLGPHLHPPAPNILRIEFDFVKISGFSTTAPNNDALRAFSEYG